MDQESGHGIPESFAQLISRAGVSSEPWSLLQAHVVVGKIYFIAAIRVELRAACFCQASWESLSDWFKELSWLGQAHPG